MNHPGTRIARGLRRRGGRLWRRLSGRTHRSTLRLGEQRFLELLALPDRSGTPDWDAVLAHFDARAAAGEFPYPQSMAPPAERRTLIHRADALARGEFALAERPPVTFDGEVDWNFDPTGDPRRRWARELNRHRWMPVLVRAWELTGEDRYANACTGLIRSWVAANPPPLEQDEGHTSWNLMNVGLRCMVWPATFFRLLGTPVFTRQDRCLMLRSLCDHGRFLRLYKTHANHLLRESNGLANLAAWFPEFREAGLWRQVALERLGREAREQVNEDGSHVEMSPAYQWLVAEEFEETLDILQRAGWALPGVDLPGTLRHLYRALAAMRLPNGTWPQLNDGFFGAWEDYTARLERAAQRFDCPELLATRCHSEFLPDAGLGVMRDDAGDCLICKGGPYGGLHGHEDKLSIEVHVAGEPLIVDPGTYTYNAADPYRAHFVSSHSHNTVTIDGSSQVRRRLAPHRIPRRGPDGPVRWISTAGFDLYAGRYVDGYGRFEFYPPPDAGRHVDRTLAHERCIIFCRGDYWLIVDDVEGAGEHNLVRGFQGAADVSIRVLDGQARLAGRAAGLVLAWAEPDARASLACGEPPPLGGWVSDGRVGDKRAAPRLTLSTRRTGGARFLTLLAPMTAAGEARFHSAAVVGEGADGLEVAVSGPGVQDSWTLRDVRTGAGNPAVHLTRREAGRESLQIAYNSKAP